MMDIKSVALLGAIGLGMMAFSMSSMAYGAEFDSAYTDLDLEQDCTIITADDFGALFACPGYRGIPVSVAEGDIRMFVSYGLTSQDERASEQTLGPFNDVGKKIEWRLKKFANGWVPVATILRFHTDVNGYKGQVLIVTNIEPGNTCHIGYVDARANANANQLARDAAEEFGRNFDCAREPMVLGVRGRSY